MLITNAGVAVIANGGTDSAAVDLGERVLTAIIMPAAWTAANITFKAAERSDGTFRTVKRADGSTTAIAAYTITTPAADDHITVNPADFAGMRYIKVVSSGAQGAERRIQLLGGILS